mgnify:CR=1 FL=1
MRMGCFATRAALFSASLAALHVAGQHLACEATEPIHTEPDVQTVRPDLYALDQHLHGHLHGHLAHSYRVGGERAAA